MVISRSGTHWNKVEPVGLVGVPISLEFNTIRFLTKSITESESCDGENSLALAHTAYPVGRLNPQRRPSLVP